VARAAGGRGVRLLVLLYQAAKGFVLGGRGMAGPADLFLGSTFAHPRSCLDVPDYLRPLCALQPKRTACVFQEIGVGRGNQFPFRFGKVIIEKNIIIG
jgi:hypothetical protein